MTGFSLRILHKYARTSILTLLFFSAVFNLHAQFYNGSHLSFGKNRVQYQKFNWTYFRTPQFDVYFYPTGKALAEYTLFKATQFLDDIEKRLNYTSPKKLQFIVYNTQSDFRESNFAYDDENFYNQGGVTSIYGTKIYLYFDGNHENLDRMIRSGIMNIYAHLIVEGSTVGSNISAETFLDIPNWYYDGLSSYFGETWNSEIDNKVKDGILTGRYVDFDELPPLEACYAGHSFWKFIADKYGENSIATILYATRSAKNYEKGFLYVTGVDFRKLIIDWYQYYYAIYRQDTLRTTPATAGELKRPKSRRDYNQLRLSPDGESYAYVTNEAGQVKIWVKTPDMKKPKKIFRRYQKTEDNPDFTFPLLAWHPTGELIGFTLEHKGRCYYYPYVLENRKLEKRLAIEVEKITDISYSNDGRMLLFSGFKNGQSDIFIYSFASRSFQQITNDIFDDYAPRFINNQKQIVFSSTRNHDTLKTNEKFYQVTPLKKYDLFLYNYEKKDKQLLRITRTPYASESNVREINGREIMFLSDENGIRNRYIARFDSVISKIDTIVHYAYSAKTAPVTDYAFSIVEQDYAPVADRLGEIVLYKGVKRIYLKELATPKVSFNKPILSSAFQVQAEKEQLKRDSVAAAQRLKMKSSGTRRGFYQIRQGDIMGTKNDSSSVKRPALGFQPDILTEGLEYVQQVARNYYVQYSINKLVTQADFSFLNTSYQQFTGGTSPIYLNAGFNAFIMVGINDLFEDHRITGGFRFGFDLNSTEFMLSYENLSRRVDHQIVFYRQAMRSMISQYLYKQQSNSLFYITRYPFDKLNSIRLTLTARYDRFVTASLNDRSLQEPDRNNVWGGIKVEFVHDSAKELSLNLWRGTKIKLFAEYLQMASRENKNLFVVGFDIRKSVKVYKNMTWATRVAGSTNIGTSRLVYYMGGIDDWLFAKFNSDIWVDPAKNYAYQTLATNMRGFAQNTRNGTSFVLLSTELRIPFVQLIAQKKVGSAFLNSLQAILFGDFGTAWTGASPYSEENSLYTRYIYSGPITVKVKRQVEPFIAGFGLGLRASIFGYFIRLDYAWGVEDYKITDNKGMFMFSLGLDF